MFVNLSNHRKSLWAPEQIAAAGRWGEIVDYSFPMVAAEEDEAYIEDLAGKITEEMIALNPSAVMCQGEFTLTYAIVSRLKAHGITVVAACSERIVEEKLEDGEYKKTAKFRFVRFRQY